MSRCYCESCLHYRENACIEYYDIPDGTILKEKHGGCNYSECIFTSCDCEDEWDGFGRG